VVVAKLGHLEYADREQGIQQQRQDRDREERPAVT
jgi:hypothetical protein